MDENAALSCVIVAMIMSWASSDAVPLLSGVNPIAVDKYEGWNFNSGNYLFTTDTK